MLEDYISMQKIIQFSITILIIIIIIIFIFNIHDLSFFYFILFWGYITAITTTITTTITAIHHILTTKRLLADS